MIYALLFHLQNEKSEHRALGVIWNTKRDTFGFNIKLYDVNNCVTKRILLKTLATIYDPIGIASPVLITSKKLFQP